MPDNSAHSQPTELESEQAKLDNLRKQIAAVRLDTAQARRDLRLAYRQAHEDRFKGVNIVHALTGAPALHRLTLPLGGIFYFQLPSAQTIRDTDAFAVQVSTAFNAATAAGTTAAKAAPPIPPLAPSEAIVLSWLVRIETGTGQVLDLTGLSLEHRLSRIRALPDALLSRLADEALAFDAYLRTCLEIELGNY